MNNQECSIYEAIKKFYPQECENLGYYDDRNLKAFINCNTHNVVAKRYEGGPHFYCSPTYRGYSAYYRNGGIIYLSTFAHLYKSYGEEVDESIAFRLDQNITCVKVNKNGFFIEHYNLDGTITTYCYDYEAARSVGSPRGGGFTVESAMYNLFYWCGDALIFGERDQRLFDVQDITPEKIKEKFDIEPDYVITMKEEQPNVKTNYLPACDIIYEEDGEIVDRVQIEADYINEPFYKTYYKFMQGQGLFLKNGYPFYIDKNVLGKRP